MKPNLIVRLLRHSAATESCSFCFLEIPHRRPDTIDFLLCVATIFSFASCIVHHVVSRVIDQSWPVEAIILPTPFPPHSLDQCIVHLNAYIYLTAGWTWPADPCILQASSYAQLFVSRHCDVFEASSLPSQHSIPPLQPVAIRDRELDMTNFHSSVAIISQPDHFEIFPL
jgi:hypothetical protein